MALNRQGTCNAVRDLLLADTGTLYGTDKLVQDISSAQLTLLMLWT